MPKLPKYVEIGNYFKEKIEMVIFFSFCRRAELPILKEERRSERRGNEWRSIRNQRNTFTGRL